MLLYLVNSLLCLLLAALLTGILLWRHNYRKRVISSVIHSFIESQSENHSIVSSEEVITLICSKILKDNLREKDIEYMYEVYSKL